MKILRTVFAIPLAVLASFILPLISMKILKIFLFWLPSIDNLTDNYIAPFIAGSITVGLPYVISFYYNKLSSIISFLFCILFFYWDFRTSNNLNYSFAIGSLFGLIIVLLGDYKKNKEVNY